MPFVASKDWSMIAEWNANSVLGAYHRHNQMCIESLDKTKAQTKDAIRDDVGTEISKNRLAGLVFRNEVQSLNVRRSQLIFDTLNKNTSLSLARNTFLVPKVNQQLTQMMWIKLKSKCISIDLRN